MEDLRFHIKEQKDIFLTLNILKLLFNGRIFIKILLEPQIRQLHQNIKGLQTTLNAQEGLYKTK